MRVQLQPSFILHVRPYRDTSQLLEVFTPQYGRLTLVARGVRRTGKGRSPGSHLQPFVPLLLSFSGRSEMKTLGAHEVAGEAALLKGERLYSGLYLNELLVRLLHQHDPHPGLFAAYGEAIEDLGRGAPVDVTLRLFEFRLLEELGYSFDLTVDGHSGELVAPGRWYCYQSDHGMVEREGGGSSQVALYSGEELLALSGGLESALAQKVAKRLLRQVLADHLGDRPLRSRELFHRRSQDKTEEHH